MKITGVGAPRIPIQEPKTSELTGSVGVGKKNSFIIQNKLLQNCITGYIKNIYKSKYIPAKRIPIQ